MLLIFVFEVHSTRIQRTFQNNTESSLKRKRKVEERKIQPNFLGETNGYVGQCKLTQKLDQKRVLSEEQRAKITEDSFKTRSYR